MLKIEYIKNLIKPVALLLCLAVLGAFLFSLSTQESPQTKQTEIAYGDVYEGFKKGTIISRTIITKIGDIYETTDALRNEKMLHYVSPEKRAEGVYEAQYRIKNLEKKYVDMLFLINTEDNKIKATISGLNPYEKVSLKLGNKEIYSNISTDWSGKIVLESSLFNKTKICAFILKRDHNAQSICHHTQTKGDMT